MATIKGKYGPWSEVALTLLEEGNVGPSAKEIADRFWADSGGAISGMARIVEEHLPQIRQVLKKKRSRLVCPVARDYYTGRLIEMVDKNGKKITKRKSFRAYPPQSREEAIKCLPRGKRTAVGLYFPANEDDLLYRIWLEQSAARVGGASNGLIRRIGQGGDESVLTTTGQERVLNRYRDRIGRNHQEMHVRMSLPFIQTVLETLVQEGTLEEMQSQEVQRMIRLALPVVQKEEGAGDD